MAESQNLPGASLHEGDIEASVFSDRWSKDLVGGPKLSTTSGFSLGVAGSHGTEFELQVHDDQEALYVIDGEGEVRVGEDVYPARPGVALYVPPNTPHATRRTGDSPVRLVYAHGAV